MIAEHARRPDRVRSELERVREFILTRREELLAELSEGMPPVRCDRREADLSSSQGQDGPAGLGERSDSTGSHRCCASGRPGCPSSPNRGRGQPRREGRIRWNCTGLGGLLGACRRCDAAARERREDRYPKSQGRVAASKRGESGIRRGQAMVPAGLGSGIGRRRGTGEEEETHRRAPGSAWHKRKAAASDFWSAARGGDLEALGHFLETGTRPNERDMFGSTGFTGGCGRPTRRREVPPGEGSPSRSRELPLRVDARHRGAGIHGGKGPQLSAFLRTEARAADRQREPSVHREAASRASWDFYCGTGRGGSGEVGCQSALRRAG